MRIDVFFDAFPHPAKPHLETQLLEWRRQGHILRVISLHPHPDATSALEATAIHTLRQRPLWLAFRIIWRVLSCPRRTLRIFRHAKFLREAIKCLAQDAQLPSDPPEIHFVHNLTAAIYFSYLKSAEPDVPLAIYYHGGELPGMRQIPPADSARALRCADLVFSNTQASIKEVIERGAAPDRVACAPTSFDLELFPDPDRRSYLPANRWRFVCVGRMSPEKGFRVALEAFAALRRSTSAFDVTFIGDGPELETLKQSAQRLHLQDVVRFLGHVESARLIPLLADFDALVLSSLAIDGVNWTETQAAVMQEAMLMRALVIASDFGGVRESLPAALHSYLYTPGSPEALLARLISLTSCNQETVRALGQEARQFVIENYDIRKVNARLLARLAALRPSPCKPPARILSRAPQ